MKKKVSCHVITYNHINYISQCIEGILMQKTDFEFEIIIGDDLSTDGTREILENYAIQNPSLIKLNLRTERGLGIPGKENFVSTLQMCKGEYITLCDGDDYWTDPYKLQKQVDFLEANPDYVLSFHKVKILKPDGSLVPDFITKVPENYETQETLARLGNYIHTPSVVFRNIIKELPKEFLLSPIGDFYLYMLLTEHGKIKYLEDEMAVYRDGVGIWSAQSNYSRNLKTTYTHALIVSSLSENNLVQDILKDRILKFINTFQSELKPDDLILLNTCSFLEKAVYTFLLSKVSNAEKVEIVSEYSVKKLIKVIIKRVKNKIWK